MIKCIAVFLIIVYFNAHWIFHVLTGAYDFLVNRSESYFVCLISKLRF